MIKHVFDFDFALQHNITYLYTCTIKVLSLVTAQNLPKLLCTLITVLYSSWALASETVFHQ